MQPRRLSDSAWMEMVVQQVASRQDDDGGVLCQTLRGVCGCMLIIRVSDI